MHVVVDGRAIPNQLDGIGRYSLNVIQKVIELSDGIDFTVILRKDLEKGIRSKIENTASIIECSSHMSVKGFLTLGRTINRLNPHLYHSLFMFKPFNLKVPSIVTIHDIMWLTRPKEQARSSRLRFLTGYLFHYLFVSHGISSCDRIIAVSNETAREVTDFRPRSSEKIRVIGEGVDAVFLENQDHPGYLSNLERFGLADQSYLLHISNGKPYKNTGAVIEAFSRITDQSPVKLVIIGRKSAFSGHITELIEKHHLSDRVHFLGSVQNDDVVALLRGATALVFPSLYEGFGLPVIEAMASKCPVLTSDRGALKEVAGDSALLVDPQKVEDIAQGIERMVSDQKLRNDLIRKGIKQAAIFNWSEVAAGILDLYREYSPPAHQANGARQVTAQGLTI